MKPISAKRISTSKKEKNVYGKICFLAMTKYNKPKTKHKRQKANGVNLSYFSTTKKYLWCKVNFNHEK